MDYSVLLSVYQKEQPEYLAESLESVFAQTVSPAQVVLVGDGPLTDALLAVIDDFAARYPTFQFVPIKENGGLGRALAEGLKHCRCELVARMDTDDIALPTRFEHQLDAFASDETLTLCGGQMLEFIGTPSHVVSQKRVPLTHEEILAYARKRNPFNHPTVMFKKSAVEAAGGYRHAPLFEDYDLWARMLVKGDRTCNLGEDLIYFRTGEDQYARRGGWKYFQQVRLGKREIYRTGLMSRSDYLVSVAAHAVVCLMPNGLRGFIYRKLLRRGKEEQK